MCIFRNLKNHLFRFTLSITDLGNGEKNQTVTAVVVFTFTLNAGYQRELRVDRFCSCIYFTFNVVTEKIIPNVFN